MAYLFKTFRQLTYQQPGQGDLNGLLREEVANIIKTIDQDLFEMQSQNHAEFYVQKVELAIANNERIINAQIQNNDSIERAKHLESCLSCLDDIQYHIEQVYAVYRDNTRVVSERTLVEVSKKLNTQKEKLKDLLDRNNISPKLKKVILHPIQNLGENPGAGVSQQRVEYLAVFIDELIQFMEVLVTVEEQQLLQCLLVLNFNDITLLCYICDHYKSIKEKIEDDKSLLDHLHQSKNQLNSIPQSSRRPYSEDLRDLKIQVQTWIQEEIINVKKSIKQKSKEEKKGNGAKLKFDYSVDLITCFFRLLHDTKVIDSGANQTIRWIVQNISSKNQPHISQQSIQRKFFEKYPNRQQLKELVIKLLNHLNHK